MPALPQQTSDSFNSTNSSPGIAAINWRGALRIRCAWPRWQGSWYVARGNRAEVPIDLDPGKKFRYIPHFGTERTGLIVIFPVNMFEKQRILLQHRTAARRIRDEIIVAAVEERPHVYLSEFACFIANPGMDVQGAAASLRFGNHDLTTIFRQYSDRSIIQSRERQVCNATSKKRNAVANIAIGSDHLAQTLSEKRLLHSR